MADALAGEIGKDDQDERSRPTHFIVETHSETLVNRLGSLIADEKIKAEDVQVVLFEPSTDEERITEARVARFDANGTLIDWPYGFFQAEF